MRSAGHYQFVLCCACALVIGCGGDSTPMDVIDADLPGEDLIVPDTIEDVIPVDNGERDAIDVSGDLNVPDVPPQELPIDVEGDALADLPDEDTREECPGRFMCECESAAGCYTGLCVPTMDKSVCTKFCTGASECPDGWSCNLINTGVGDPSYACVPAFPDLCRPCTADQDCIPVFGAGNRIFKCLPHGADGSFCGAECIGSRECPEGFTCEDVGQGDDAVTQCVPEGGVCPCTDRYENAGYETNCSKTNEFGTCTGTRTCDAECGAADAAAETCNNFDDDCNGITDDNVAPEECPLTNTVGTCIGRTVCSAGNKLCQGAYATTEACNQFDDDCDGATDDGLGQTTCGTGICNHTIDNCQNGLLVDCDPMEGALPEECDGLDNDCNGVTDNGFVDTDQDLAMDCVDNDDDDDTILDGVDNCPMIDNPGQENLDLDLLGDVCDPDRDGDDVVNDIDNCPGRYNPDQTDRNENGIGDDCEDDLDDDGILNLADNCPWISNAYQEDTDSDTYGDVCDCDIDGDNVFNAGFDFDNVVCPTPAPVDNCPTAGNPGQENFDDDQYGDVCDCDRDGDGSANTAYGCSGTDADCAPLDPAVHPAATEKCNGIDDNCDVAVDEGCDNDSDDWCDMAMTTVGNPPVCPNGGGDCNDEEFGINPAMLEACNGIDDNCAGGVDNGLGSTTCGLGQCQHTVANCIGGDPQTCNPLQGQTPEICDNIDNDCDGATDDGCDDDNDDYCDKTMTISGTPAVCPKGGNDCNDDNDDVNPGAVETCNDVDDNCSGVKDEGLGTTTCGLGVCTHTIDNCVGGNPQNCNPMQGATTESCDGLDNSCEGNIDEGCDDDSDDYCDKTMAMSGTPAVCPNGGGDCDDDNGLVKPGALEKCDDIDNNCDSDTDLGCDDDNDNYCDLNMTTVGFPSTCTAGGGDCADTVPGRNPGATETCNGIDDNCNGANDEGLGTITCGLGICNHTIQACVGGETQTCDPMQGASTEVCDGLNNDCDVDGTDEGCDDDSDDYCDKAMGTTGTPAVCPNGGNDCDDGSSAINPGRTETCNNVDDNCNNAMDEGIASAVDGYESNNTCQTALDLGTFAEDGAARIFSGTIYPSGDADYYYGLFDEAGGVDCIPFTDQDYRVRIRLTPPAGADCVNYQIVILNNSCTELTRTTTTGCGERTLLYDWDGACGSDDSETYRFAVIPNGTADWECVGYTLSVEMDAI